MNTGIFLGLGSNLGDRPSNLKQAIRFLDLDVAAASSIYETEPVDYINQPWFLNQIIKVDTNLNAVELLAWCQNVENKLGRTREVEKGPRTIDIDLLLYNDAIIQSSSLTLPHPGIQHRRFVLVPLDEIAPNFVHPVLKCSIRELLEQCSDRSEVRRIEPT